MTFYNITKLVTVLSEEIYAECQNISCFLSVWATVIEILSIKWNGVFEHAGTEKLKYLQWSSTCSEKFPAKLHILFGIQSVGQELLTNWKVPRASCHTFAPFFLPWLIHSFTMYAEVQPMCRQNLICSYENVSLNSLLFFLFSSSSS